MPTQQFRKAMNFFFLYQKNEELSFDYLAIQRNQIIQKNKTPTVSGVGSPETALLSENLFSTKWWEIILNFESFLKRVT